MAGRARGDLGAAVRLGDAGPAVAGAAWVGIKGYDAMHKHVHPSIIIWECREVLVDLYIGSARWGRDGSARLDEEEENLRQGQRRQ